MKFKNKYEPSKSQGGKEIFQVEERSCPELKVTLGKAHKKKPQKDYTKISQTYQNFLFFPSIQSYLFTL